MQKILYIILFFLISLNINAEMIKPDPKISAKDVISIQLKALQINNLPFEDAGIEQTWEFAHPKNKSFTGPYDKFKNMIKKDSYSILINHKSHEVKEMFKNENVATYEVVILGKDKKFYKFKWQVEKYNKEGPLKNCWLTTAVLAPKVLGSSV